MYEQIHKHTEREAEEVVRLLQEARHALQDINYTDRMLLDADDRISETLKIETKLSRKLIDLRSNGLRG